MNIIHSDSRFNQLSTWNGRYRPLSQSSSEFIGNLEADITALEQNAWIDAQTAMVFIYAIFSLLLTSL